ncbi:MAG: pilus assembly protein PilY [Ramlibacter sp.]|nr:pilus assembly protein PilY [Ramlibacter sp.]
MKQRIFQIIAALLVFVAHISSSVAEDIELFVGVPPSAGETPNVLIIMDNTANWNNAFVNEKAALVQVFSKMPVNKFRIGLMMFTETGGGNSGQDGAYVRAAARTITGANTPTYASLIGNLHITDDKSNGGKVAKAMMEAYYYLSGGAPHAGNNKQKTDYSGNTDGSNFDDAVHALAGNALTSKSATAYVKPGTGECIKNYIIYISNGPAQDNSSDITTATNALAAAGGKTATISLNPSGSQDNPADEWARFLKKSSVRGVVYTLDVDKGTSGQGPGWTALLKSMASQSGGRYFDVASTGTGIQDAINSILSEVQSVNSVFASVSLPVSVNTQGTYLNQVYVGMFRPDGDASPRWKGNLKQYRMALVNGEVKLVDAQTTTPLKSAINNQTGFITECARSYWTPSTVDTEWNAAQESDCLTVTGAESSNYPDGNVVAKGGQAYMLRGGASRNTLTCNTAACSSLVTFNSSNVTQSQLGVTSTTALSSLVDWAKGVDNFQDEDLDGSSTDNRLSMHGDVVHSRPVAVNFGTPAVPKVVVFYGANDGWFRAINGNRTDAIGSVAAGAELWSFAPPEFLAKFGRLRSQSPVTYYLNTPVTSATTKDYAIDGPITAYRGTVGASSATKTFVYATMRRGGRSIYAFDVSNAATAPTSPSLKWRIGCMAAGDCTTDMGGIGQTWGAIKTFTHGTYASGTATTPLLIFGGGYDSCEDYDQFTSTGANHNCTSSSKGHQVYVVNGDTGARVAAFDTSSAVLTSFNKYRGVIADIALVSGSDGHAKYAYVADLGGNVFRITMTGSASTWTIKQIASLGCAADGSGATILSSCVANRKFMFAPSVVNTATGEYTIMLGSGDREKPITGYTSATAVTNYFFQFKDKPGDASYPGTTDCGQPLICLNSLQGIARDAASPTSLGSKKGWYLGLNSTEQVVTQPLTIFSVVTFSTHEPAVPRTTTTTSTTASTTTTSSTRSSNVCSNLGTTRVYNVGYEYARPVDGDARYEDVAGDGLPPSATAGLVTLDTGETVPFCIGCSADSPLESKKPTASSSAVMPKGRIYWYLNKK